MTTTEPTDIQTADKPGPFATVFDDHGLTWQRAAQREWAYLSDHMLVVLPAFEPTPDAGIAYFVIRAEHATGAVDPAHILARGTVATRPAARQAAVLALANIASPPPPVEVEPTAPAHGRWQRAASTAILLVLLTLFVGATVVGVMR